MDEEKQEESLCDFSDLQPIACAHCTGDKLEWEKFVRGNLHAYRD